MDHFNIKLDGFDIKTLMEGSEVVCSLNQGAETVTISATPNAISNYNNLKKKE